LNNGNWEQQGNIGMERMRPARDFYRQRGCGECERERRENAQEMRHGHMLQNGMSEQNVMKLVYELGFAMTETVLYLDTHPDDAEALAYYAEMKEKYHDAVRYYSKNFGPLSSLHVNAENYWSWVMTPMPWEVEGC
jgi:spore coat protein JB